MPSIQRRGWIINLILAIPVAENHQPLHSVFIFQNKTVWLWLIMELVVRYMIENQREYFLGTYRYFSTARDQVESEMKLNRST